VLDQPIADVWPDADASLASVTGWELLDHRACLGDFPVGVAIALPPGVRLVPVAARVRGGRSILLSGIGTARDVAAAYLQLGRLLDAGESTRLTGAPYHVTVDARHLFGAMRPDRGLHRSDR